MEKRIYIGVMVVIGLLCGIGVMGGIAMGHLQGSVDRLTYTCTGK